MTNEPDQTLTDRDAVKTERAYEALRTHLNPAGKPMAWCVLREVWNGLYNDSRHCDAIAICLWASKGREIWGFETKSSRQDWLNELKTPEKSSFFRQRCDRWWVLAAEPDIVKKDELPVGWGLMEVTSRGIRRSVPATLNPDPPIFDRNFAVGLARVVAKTLDRTPAQAELVAAEGRGYKRGQEDAQMLGDGELQRLRHESESWKKTRETFYRQTGIQLNEWNAEKFGRVAAVAVKARDGRAAILEEMRRVARHARQLAEQTDRDVDLWTREDV